MRVRRLLPIVVLVLSIAGPGVRDAEALPCRDSWHLSPFSPTWTLKYRNCAGVARHRAADLIFSPDGPCLRIAAGATVSLVTGVATRDYGLPSKSC